MAEAMEEVTEESPTLCQSEFSYSKKDLLGKGSFGKVYKGIWNRLSGDQCVAIKKIKATTKNYERELVSLRRGTHKNIVKYFGFYNNDDSLWLIFELSEIGDLKTYIEKNYPVPDVSIWKIAKDIAEGIRFLHKEIKPRIIHRDLKSENVLLFTEDNKSLVAKICDFGIAKDFDHTTVMTAFKGTIHFMAPEVAKGGKQNRSLASDIWSFGCILVHIVTGNKPFKGFELYPLLIGLGTNTISTIPAEYNGIFKQNILMCLKQEPTERFTIEEIIAELDASPPTQEPEGTPSGPVQIPGPVEEAGRLADEDGAPWLDSDIKESDFTKADKIGHGSFGSIYKAVWKSNENKLVAIKQIDKTKISYREIETLQHTSHRNIVKYFGCFTSDTYGIKVSLVFELADGGDLHSYIRRCEGPVPEEISRQFAMDIALGVRFLHDEITPAIIHRDLKSGNVLVFTDMEHGHFLKICDFGLAKEFDHTTMMTELRGTVHFMAPEVARGGSEKRSLASDLWSYGAILLHLVTRRMPFDDMASVVQVLFVLGNNTIPTLPAEYKGFLRIIIEQCLRADPKERITISRVVAELQG